MPGRNLIGAATASAIMSVPMAVVSTTVVQVDGNLLDLISHPGFWVYFARACGWYFVAAFFASVLTLFVTVKKATNTP